MSKIGSMGLDALSTALRLVAIIILPSISHAFLQRFPVVLKSSKHEMVRNAIMMSASTVGRQDADSRTVTDDFAIPGAGRRPPWENRPVTSGSDLSSSFLQSDLEGTVDLTGLQECPLTRWSSDLKSIGGSIEQAQQLARTASDASLIELDGQYPPELRADVDGPMGAQRINAQGAEYFREHRAEILGLLRRHGCVWLRGFELPRTVRGYRAMWEALGLAPCLDPLHSSGLRKFASQRDGLYEEVNKPALRQHYIGLHQESTAKRTAAYAAFVCFQRATEQGGRFTVADGATILANMQTGTLRRLYGADDTAEEGAATGAGPSAAGKHQPAAATHSGMGVRISVSNLDTPLVSKDGLSGLLRGAFKSAEEALVEPKFDMDLQMVWEADGKRPGRLQALEGAESPINAHPLTGLPVWFCNAHNHLRYLRDRRPCAVPEVGMTDVFLANRRRRREHSSSGGNGREKWSEEGEVDLLPVSAVDCEEVRRACEESLVALPMEAGDVLLLDNYRTLHGRETFSGQRLHAVTWFTWGDDCPADWRDERDSGGGDGRGGRGGRDHRGVEGRRSKDTLNKLVNKYLDWLPKDV